MADTLPELLGEFSAAPGRAVQAMEQAFGPCSFVYLYRIDDVAQAASRLKAEQSQSWHINGAVLPLEPGPVAYDASLIDEYRAEAAEGNATWCRWFKAEKIKPYRTDYETLSIDPPGRVRELLCEVGLPVPQDVELSFSNQRMANLESAAWAVRYRDERGICTNVNT